jgi:hypothetical protein
VEFEVGGDCSRYQFTARGHSHAKLQGFGFEEESLCVDAQGGQGNATEEAEKDVADDDGPQVSFWGAGMAILALVFLMLDAREF